MTSKATLMADMVESIKQASGASAQLIHHLQHPGFIVIRNTLDTVVADFAKYVDYQLTHAGMRQ